MPTFQAQLAALHLAGRAGHAIPCGAVRFITLLACSGLFFVAALAPQSRAAPAQPPGYDADVLSLIDGLADPSPVTREQSKQKLIAMGTRARPALVDAWRGNDPRIGPVAGEILLKLPWALPSDPPGVRRVLSGYGDQEEDKRRET